jgi:hypothetical protein
LGDSLPLEIKNEDPSFKRSPEIAELTDKIEEVSEKNNASKDHSCHGRQMRQETNSGSVSQS